MASSNNGSASRNCKESEEIKEKLNTLRKMFAENGTMDRFKEIFEAEVKKNQNHKENIEKLHNILTGSLDQVSYENAFKELGGPAFKSKVGEEDDLDGILRKLVKENNVALPEEEKKKLFEEWDRELKK
ncbi:uncharacterized protein [Anabrus simplex]|uniref:uncharacterized protein isoform X2 n=1 Tax=Anabrus simplex TaxID=316456 RepID=UPI0035A2FBF7